MPDLPLALAGAAIDVGNDAAASGGVTVSAHGTTANAKGSWTQLVASTAHEAAWLVVGCRASPANNSRHLIDIGIGPAAGEVVLIPDLYAESIVFQAVSVLGFTFPVRVPRGSRLAARQAGTLAANTAMVAVNLIAPHVASPWPFSRTEALGAVPGSSAGTQVDPGATANADGAWVQLLPATSFPYRWLNVAFGHSASTTGLSARYLVDIGIGAAGSEVVAVPDLLVTNETTTDTPYTTYSFPVMIPQGVRVAARCRATANTATNRIIDVIAWGSG